MEILSMEKEYMEMKLQNDQWQKQFNESEIKLRKWEEEFQKGQINIIVSNGIVIKKIFNV